MSDLPPRQCKVCALRRGAPWFLLLLVSVLAGGLFRLAGIPAAFFVAAVVCGMSFNCFGGALRLPRPFFVGAQALIGGAVAHSITGEVISTVSRNWATMLLMVACTVFAGGAVGWLLTRWKALPGATAAWGSSPGGASAMVAMAEAYGADVRLVALMQYLRVLAVVLTASLGARWLAGSGGAGVVASALPPLNLFAPNLVGSQVGLTLLMTAACAFIAFRLRIPAGAILLPMIAGAWLHAAGVLDVHLPNAFQIVASLLLGWYVGLGFNRASLAAAFRLLPRLLLSTVLLIALCAAFAWGLHRFMACDPLTAFLATTPGGLDSVVLIAMGSPADLPFVVAAQTVRLFVVILTGPAIARLICRFA